MGAGCSVQATSVAPQVPPPDPPGPPPPSGLRAPAPTPLPPELPEDHPASISEIPFECTRNEGAAGAQEGAVPVNSEEVAGSEVEANTVETDPKPQATLLIHQRGVTLRVLKEMQHLVRKKNPDMSMGGVIDTYIKKATSKIPGDGFITGLYHDKLDLEEWPLWHMAFTRYPAPPVLHSASPKEEQKDSATQHGLPDAETLDAKAPGRLYYVSHAHKASFDSIVNHLEGHHKNVRRDNKDLEADDIRYWLAALALDQNYTGLSAYRPEGALERVILHHSHAIILVVDPWEAPLITSRTWCMYEIMTASLADQQIEILIDPRFANMAINADAGTCKTPAAYYKSAFWEKVQMVLDNTDSGGSEATDPVEQEFLPARMQRAIGFEQLDNCVMDLLKTAYKGVLLVGAMTLGLIADVERLGEVTIPKKNRRLMEDGFVSAAGNGHLSVLQFMLDKGMSAESYSSARKFKALGWAVMQGQFEVADFLVEQGAIYNSATAKGEGTAFHAAVMCYDRLVNNPFLKETPEPAEVILPLMKHIMDALRPGSVTDVHMARSKDGMQPIHLAAKYLSPEIVEILLQQGVNPEEPTSDKSSITPLELAKESMRTALPKFDCEGWRFVEGLKDADFADDVPADEVVGAVHLKKRYNQVGLLLQKKEKKKDGGS